VILITYIVLRGDLDETLWLAGENTYVDPNKNKEPITFSPISTPPSLYISLIVPAYDEEKRITIMLDTTLAYLKKRKKNDPSFTYEILVVDDGSRDDTDGVVLKYIKKETVEAMRLLKLHKNRGKGGALKRVCSVVA
jgi:dolichyl-phosphate beta-glucosyltransferase